MSLLTEEALSCVCKLTIDELLRAPEAASFDSEFADTNSEAGSDDSSDEEEEDEQVKQLIKQLDELTVARDALAGKENRKRRQKANQRIRALENQLDRLKYGDDGCNDDEGHSDDKDSESASPSPQHRGKSKPHSAAADEKKEDVDKQKQRKQQKQRKRSSSRSSSSRSSRSSGEEDGDDSSDFDEDEIYEETLFRLSRLYDFVQRLSISQDVGVYAAWDRANKRLVTLKIKAGLPSTQRVPKDIRIHTLLQQYPYFPKLYNWYRLPDQDAYAVSLEMLDNALIENCIFKHPDKTRKMRRYVQDVLLGIEVMHKHNIMFRDIKTSNVLWNDHEEKAIIIDFDTATFERAEGHTKYYGTRNFQAPDQDPKEVKRYGKAIDLWSAGVVLGQLIYEFEENAITSSRHEEATGEAFERRAKDNIAAGKGTAAEDLMLRLLDRDPATRITATEALKHAFFSEEVKVSSNASGPGDTPVVTAPPQEATPSSTDTPIVAPAATRSTESMAAGEVKVELPQ